MIAPLLAGHDTAEADGAVEDVELATELVKGELGVADDTAGGLGVVDDTAGGLGIVEDTGGGIGAVEDTAGGLEDELPDTHLAPQTFELLLGLPRPLLR
jgi:hypothetical protein